jgi:hypothetical protein
VNKVTQEKKLNTKKNIICIGTSNCVIGRNGWIKSLSKKHKLTNLSIGRCPFYMHIVTIQRNKTLIEENDLLIIDHLSNPGFINSYKYNDYLVEFYNLLASLNINIIIISFPYLKKEAFYIEHTLLAQKLAFDRKLTFIDFKAEYVRKEFYSDPQHIDIFTSYIFGEWLAEVCDVLDFLSKPTKGSFSGFKIITPKNYNNKFKTSLVNVDYYDLNTKEIQFDVNGHLLSIEYISNGINTFTLNNKCYHIDSFEKGLFHDSFDHEFYVNSTLKIKDSNCQNSQAVLDRNSIINKNNSKSLFLVSLLFAESFQSIPSINRSFISFNIDTLQAKLNDYEYIVNKMKNEKKELEDKDADLLRDLALKYEKNKLLSIEDAHYLMSLAHKARPTGPINQQKLKEYKELINK